jgi:hypothetical protein
MVLPFAFGMVKVGCIVFSAQTETQLRSKRKGLVRVAKQLLTCILV